MVGKAPPKRREGPGTVDEEEKLGYIMLSVGDVVDGGEDGNKYNTTLRIRRLGLGVTGGMEGPEPDHGECLP